MQEEMETWQQYTQSREHENGRDEQLRHTLFAFYKSWADDEASWIYRHLNINGAYLEEFKQCAYQGLLESIDRFNPNYKKSFKAFARQRVRGAILSSLPSLSETSSFYANRGRYLNNDLLPSAQFDISDNDEPISVMVSMVMTMAVEYLLKHGESDLTQLTGEFYSSPEINTIAQRVRDHVETLEEPMQSIIKLYYFQHVSFDKAAKLLALSNSRVSQLHSQALQSLKARAGW